jgi:hypothetical protein
MSAKNEKSAHHFSLFNFGKNNPKEWSYEGECGS